MKAIGKINEKTFLSGDLEKKSHGLKKDEKRSPQGRKRKKTDTKVGVQVRGK